MTGGRMTGGGMTDGGAVRVLFDGDVFIAYGQAYVHGGADDRSDGDTSMEDSFAGQVNGLCGAAVPGTLFLMTGTSDGHVRFTVELHEGEPPLPPAGWEEVVEVSFATTFPDVALADWGGEWRAPLDLGHDRRPAGTAYRVRYCALGMTEARRAPHEFDGDAPRPDRYLLQFWPVPPGRHGPDAILRRTTAEAEYWHDFARSLPPPPSATERAEAKHRALAESRRRLAEADRLRELERWGGREPTDRLRQLGNQHVVRELARLDADLVHAMSGADAGTQRRIARWAAERAFAAAGIPYLDWLTPAWRAVDAGGPLPEGLADPNWLLCRILGTDRAGRPGVAPAPGLPATVPDDLLPTEVDAVPAAVMALVLAATADPLQAAIQAVWATTGARADDRAFLAELRRTFPSI